jgi:plastocyanin
MVAGTAQAAAVRGTVLLPAEPRPPDQDAHWRVENGMVAIGPRVPDPHLDVLVALESTDAHKESLPNATVELHGVRLDPRVTFISIGGTVEFKNNDRVPHTLYLDRASSLMPATPTPAGQTRGQKFFAAGEYQIRDEEYPHVEGTVVVLATPYVTRLDERGIFKLEVPEGKYTLRVLWHGSWVVQQTLEVGSRTTEVTVQVPATGSKR